MTSAALTFAILDNQTLWDTAERCHLAMVNAAVPHLIVGGVAVCLHGYRRNTVDLDLLVRREDQAVVRKSPSPVGLTWDDALREFRSAAATAVQFLVAGEPAGRDSPVRLPDPAESRAQVEIEKLPVVSLARLIEMKLASDSGDLRRTHKDFADVVELIDVHQLDGRFAARLHKSVRTWFRELLRRVRSGD